MNGLHPFDIFTIVTCVLMMLWGGLHGMFSQIMSIVTLFVSWIAASQYYPLLAEALPFHEPFRDTVAMILFFIIALFVTRLAAKFIAKLIFFKVFKELDRQLGALFGLLKGFLVCLVVTFFAVVCSETLCQLVIDSPSGRLMVQMVSKIQQYVPNDQNHQKIHDALDRFSETIKNTDYDPAKAEEAAEKVKEKVSQWFSKDEASNRPLSGPLAANGSSSDETESKKSTSSGVWDDFEAIISDSQSKITGQAVSAFKEAAKKQLQQNPEVSAVLSAFQTSFSSGSSAAGTGTGAEAADEDGATFASGSILDHQNFTPFSTAPPF